MFLTYDTETTGLPDFRAPSDSPSQPHIVQLAAELTDARGYVRGAMNVLIKPDQWKIDETGVAFKTHGISNDMAHTYGIPLEDALAMFFAMVKKARLRVGHNESFDAKLVKIACKRSGHEYGLEGVESFCTMNATKEICKIPPTARMIRAGFNGYKNPSLIEAHTKLFGEGFESAHDAMVDVQAARRVFFELRRLKDVERKEGCAHAATGN